MTTATDMTVWFFGCLGEPGHYLRGADKRIEWNRVHPWGNKIDGGLCEGPKYQRADGKMWEHHKDGWTAVAFWDQSGDDRGASNTAFLVHAEVTADELIAAARLQWPEVFARPGFPIRAT